mmetsp:Transcript_86885/g.144618  ORF Transcript_86885/g.144618 Transcript_86885/m.144618 type:complete len:380 (-) Transcript_86885:409-1548(-)
MQLLLLVDGQTLAVQLLLLPHSQQQLTLLIITDLLFLQPRLVHDLPSVLHLLSLFLFALQLQLLSLLGDPQPFRLQSLTDVHVLIPLHLQQLQHNHIGLLIPRFIQVSSVNHSNTVLNLDHVWGQTPQVHDQRLLVLRDQVCDAAGKHLPFHNALLISWDRAPGRDEPLRTRVRPQGGEVVGDVRRMSVEVLQCNPVQAVQVDGAHILVRVHLDGLRKVLLGDLIELSILLGPKPGNQVLHPLHALPEGEVAAALVRQQPGHVGGVFAAAGGGGQLRDFVRGLAGPGVVELHSAVRDGRVVHGFLGVPREHLAANRRACFVASPASLDGARCQPHPSTPTHILQPTVCSGLLRHERAAKDLLILLQFPHGLPKFLRVGE